MAKFNTKPISGARDFLPVDALRRKYVINVIEQVYQSYGFEPLETPAMERLDTLLGKYGDEGDQLIFRVAKRGDKLLRALEDNPTQESIADAGLRYDLTVPLARIVAEYRNELPRYFKRYQIAPVYRADRPAKGRYREFYQCDVDIVGSTSPAVEAEVLAAGAQVLQTLGFAGNGAEGFALRLNHRGVLRGLMEVAGIPAALEGVALVAVDKLDKIGLDGVRAELLSRGVNAESTAVLMQMMTDVPESETERMGWLSDLLEGSEQGSLGVAGLKEILGLSSHGPAAPHLRLDPFLARGLSYYTGAIFEIEFPGLSGSGGAGGRYDNLVGMFSNQTMPACGLALGLDRILLVLEDRGLFPIHLSGQPQVMVTQFDESTQAASLILAHRLRGEGLRVDLYPDLDRYGRQFKYADERNIPFALLLGPNEIAQSQVAVKDLRSGEQANVKTEAVGEWLNERLGG
jgi:histidyl-tRNA synthetase